VTAATKGPANSALPAVRASLIATAEALGINVDLLIADAIGAASLPPAAPSAELSTVLSLEEMERQHIARALALAGGNKALAAKALGIDRRTIYRKLAVYKAMRAAPVGGA